MKQKVIIFILLAFGAIFVIYQIKKRPKKRRTILLLENPKIKKIDNTCNVFLDIKIRDKITRVVIQLFDEDVPKTSANFRYLCVQGLNGGRSPYIGTSFFRVIKDYIIQGGDIEHNNGTGGYSIYGKCFNDENYNLKHNQQGLIAMANKGKNKNNSQFMILTKKKGEESFNNKYVVFGIILAGFNIISDIQKIDVDKRYKPIEDIKIINCGIITHKKEDNCGKRGKSEKEGKEITFSI